MNSNYLWKTNVLLVAERTHTCTHTHIHTHIFSDIWNEEWAAVWVFVLLAAIILLSLQKFIKEARWFRLDPWIFIQWLALWSRFQLVVWALREVQYRWLRIYSLGLQLRNHGGQRHGQWHMDQRRTRQGCRAGGKLDPWAGHGRYGGEGLGPGEVGQPWVLELHLRDGGWCGAHRYGLKQQQRTLVDMVSAHTMQIKHLSGVIRRNYGWCGEENGAFL